VLKCPDCGREGEACSFFSENEEENGCSGFSRLVTLAIRCQLDGAKRRVEAQLRQRIIVLSGGEASQRAVSFATGHVKTFKDGLKLADGVWLPQDLSTKDTQFFWKRDSVPWQFSLKQLTASEAVTMSGLLSRLGIAPADAPEEAPAAPATVTALRAEVQRLTQLVDTLARSVAGGSATAGNAEALEAARLSAAAGLQHANTPAESATSLGGGWNPSQTFNLANNVEHQGNVYNSQQRGSDADLVKALSAAGAAPAQILQFLHGRTPPQMPMEHRNAWFQVAEGTSPLCVYTGMQGETRQAATPKGLRVETFDANTGGKVTLKITAWPAAKPDDVPIHRLRDLGADWKLALIEANVRLVQITPTADRGIAPAIPVNVEGFLDHCFSSLKVYDHVAILRAWEAAHQFVVDEYITKRSKPSWDSVWMMPVFQAELNRGGRATGAMGAQTLASDASQYCSNWNFQNGQKCGVQPHRECRKIHKCVRCGGAHPVVKCTQRE
jgi:hypothetical protein